MTLGIVGKIPWETSAPECGGVSTLPPFLEKSTDVVGKNESKGEEWTLSVSQGANLWPRSKHVLALIAETGAPLEEGGRRRRERYIRNGWENRRKSGWGILARQESMLEHLTW